MNEVIQQAAAAAAMIASQFDAAGASDAAASDSADSVAEANDSAAAGPETIDSEVLGGLVIEPARPAVGDAEGTDSTAAPGETAVGPFPADLVDPLGIAVNVEQVLIIGHALDNLPRVDDHRRRQRLAPHLRPPRHRISRRPESRDRPVVQADPQHRHGRRTGCAHRRPTARRRVDRRVPTGLEDRYPARNRGMRPQHPAGRRLRVPGL